jgi:hypothetical protein
MKTNGRLKTLMPEIAPRELSTHLHAAWFVRYSTNNTLAERHGWALSTTRAQWLKQREEHFLCFNAETAAYGPATIDPPARHAPGVHV